MVITTLLNNNVRENRRNNQERTIQSKLATSGTRHGTTKKQNKTNKTKKIKKISNTDLTKIVDHYLIITCHF